MPERDELLKSAKAAAKRFNERQQIQMDASLEVCGSTALLIMLKFFYNAEKDCICAALGAAPPDKRQMN
jgi:hypothetical protein